MQAPHSFALSAGASALALAATLSAQSNWSTVPSTSNPPARTAHAMAHDLGRDQIVLFSGTPGGAGNATNDTWEFDGVNWVQRSPATSPPARVGHIMAYDPVSGKTLLFGGLSTSITALNDTWEWDGTNWTQLFPTNSPAPRLSHSLTYDVANARITLFGGNPLGGAFFDDTWYWDSIAGDWVQVITANTPGPRIACGMTFDPATGGVLLQGGYQVAPETWRFDGNDWTLLAPPNNPGGRYDHVLVGDTYRGRVVLFGNGSDTWEWDGANWLLRAPATSPSSRLDMDLVWDEYRQRVVMFGGDTGDPATWEYTMSNPAAQNVIGTGCAGTAGTPSLSAVGRPWAGETFTWVASGLPPAGPSTMFIGLSNPAVDLTILGMAGCTLYCNPFTTAPLAVTGGQTSLGLAISTDPVFTGVSIFGQVLSIDPGSTALGVTASNGSEGVIGVK